MGAATAIENPELDGLDIKQRRRNDLDWYNKYKADKSVIELEDGSLTYYIVSAKWIEEWRDFVNGKKGLPGPVVNKPIAEAIMSQRRS